MIFLIAPPKLARQLKPLLSFYYAKQLPVYATSLIYSGIARPRLDRDLNGIIFCDIPWLLKSSITRDRLRNNFYNWWPHSFASAPRLYALGRDAFQLTAGGELNLLSVLQQFGLPADTGYLVMSHQAIHRRLPFAEMHHGKVSLL